MLVELKNIEKSYPALGVETPEKVLNKISLNIEPGGTLAIVGPSGSGKSTLLNIMGTLDKPDRGEFLFKGEALSLKTPTELALFRNRHMGFVFQMHHLLPQCTVMENILLPTLPFLSKEEKAEAFVRGENLLKRVGLYKHRNKQPIYLSGGERQRAAVIRALINRPPLILADEPTGSLDMDNALALRDLLLELNQEEGCALVLVTHSELMAEKMDNSFILNKGTLQKEGHK